MQELAERRFVASQQALQQRAQSSSGAGTPNARAESSSDPAAFSDIFKSVSALIVLAGTMLSHNLLLSLGL